MIEAKHKIKDIIELVEVTISNIEADEEYFSFDYKIKVNGKLKEKDKYDSDYENGNTPKQQIKMLEKGEALQLAIIRAFE